MLRKSLCKRVSGGKLDFPRHASFAGIKIVMWWEAEFTTAFKRRSGLKSVDKKKISQSDDEGVAKNMQPSEFILLVVETSEEFLGT